MADEAAPAPEVTKEQRLLTKKQHRPTPEAAETSIETVLKTSGEAADTSVEAPKEVEVNTIAQTTAQTAGHKAEQADTVVKEAHGTNGGNHASGNTAPKATAPAAVARSKAKAPDGATGVKDVAVNDVTSNDVTSNDITANDLTGDTTTGDGTVKKKRRWWKK